MKPSGGKRTTRTRTRVRDKHPHIKRPQRKTITYIMKHVIALTMISNPRSNMNHATAAFVRRELEYKRSRALKALRGNQKQTVIMRLNPPPCMS